MTPAPAIAAPAAAAPAPCPKTSTANSAAKITRPAKPWPKPASDTGEQTKFALPTESRFFSLPALEGCPRCHSQCYGPRLYRTMGKRGSIFVPVYSVECGNITCRFDPAPDQSFYSSEEAVRVWQTYARLCADRT